MSPFSSPETSDTAATLITYTLGDDIIAQGKSHWTKTGNVWAINTTGGVEATQYLLYDGHGSTRNLAEYDATSGATITAAYAYDGYGVRLGNQDKLTKQKSGLQAICVESVSLFHIAGHEAFIKPAVSLFGSSVRKTIRHDIPLG